MLYTKPKNKPKRWIFKLLEVALILGILFFGMDALHQLTSPTQATKVEVYIIQAEDTQVRNTRESEPVLDAYDYHLLGLEHHMAGEYGEAILDYSRAIALNDDIAASWLNRGVAYEQMGNRYQAMSDFNRYFQRDGMTIITRAAVAESVTSQVSMSRDRMYDFPIDLRSGQVVNLSAVSVESEWVDTLMVLVDSLGRPIAANDDTHRQDGSLISMSSYINNYTVTQSGRYYLHVSHAGGGDDGIRSGTVEVRIQIDN
jgi:hypothetical protein